VQWTKPINWLARRVSFASGTCWPPCWPHRMQLRAQWIAGTVRVERDALYRVIAEAGDGPLPVGEIRKLLPARAKWAILVYIAARNALESVGKKTQAQIVEVGSTGEVSLSVLYDSAEGARRCIVGRRGRLRSMNPWPTSTRDRPDALYEIAKWVSEQCPAERYGLILSVPGLCNGGTGSRTRRDGSNRASKGSCRFLHRVLMILPVIL